MSKNIRIVFAGIPDMALVCLDALKNSNKNIVGIIAPSKKHPCFGIMLEKARQYNIPFITYDNIKSRDFLRQIKDLKPDVGLVCSYDRLLPKALLKIPKLGFINAHPALLPNYRGGNPYFHVIKNGERQTGVTIHFMDETFDTGDIISQATMPLGGLETMGTLFNKLNLQASFLIVDTINLLEEGKTPPRIKQDIKSDFKKAPGIDPLKGDTVINWSKSCKEIDNFIRACNPFYGTTSYYRGEGLKIYNATYEIKETNAKPGQLVEISKDRFGIAAKDGVIYPNVIYFSSYAILDAKTFISIFSPKEEEIVV